MPLCVVEPEEECLDHVSLIGREEIASHVEVFITGDVPVVGHVRPQETSIVLVVPFEAEFFLLLLVQ